MLDRRATLRGSWSALRRSFVDWCCGRHSGIPRCCVAFYCVSPYSWIVEYNRNTKWSESVQYVRCPLCVMRGRSVRLHYCPSPEACGRWYCGEHAAKA